MVVLSQKSVMGETRVFFKGELSVLQGGGGGGQPENLFEHSKIRFLKVLIEMFKTFY
jgi:hypothetical protein